MNKIEKVSSYDAKNTKEVFFAFNSTPEETFEAEARLLMSQYNSLMRQNKCNKKSEIMVRFHLSDVANQVPILQNIIGIRTAFVSFIGQPPINGSRLSFEAYHITNNEKLDKKIDDDPDKTHQLDALLKNYQLFWHCCRELKPGNSFEQTDQECKILNNALMIRNGTFKDNCLRTWVFVRDIDNNYNGMVKARREYFNTIGMKKSTHYIASTGIEGQCYAPHRLIGLDALCIFGIQKSQVEFMQAITHMPPTISYGVTFERGTRLIYGDRSHYYISGTASIDSDGNIMYQSDVIAQTHRMIDNIEALLKNHGSNLQDLKTATIYIRDNADGSIVQRELDMILPDTLPRTIVCAPVCRPGWLIEMEGIAVNANGNENFKDFV